MRSSIWQRCVLSDRRSGRPARWLSCALLGLIGSWFWWSTDCDRCPYCIVGSPRPVRSGQSRSRLCSSGLALKRCLGFGSLWSQEARAMCRTISGPRSARTCSLPNCLALACARDWSLGGNQTWRLVLWSGSSSGTGQEQIQCFGTRFAPCKCRSWWSCWRACLYWQGPRSVSSVWAPTTKLGCSKQPV